MQKLNFATRVTVFSNKISSNSNDSGAVKHNRALLQTQINKRKVNIDRSVFVKTQNEKDVLKLRKSDPAFKLKGSVLMPFNNRG
jgi:hypothetical protein